MLPFYLQSFIQCYIRLCNVFIRLPFLCLSIYISPGYRQHQMLLHIDPKNRTTLKKNQTTKRDLVLNLYYSFFYFEFCNYVFSRWRNGVIKKRNLCKDLLTIEGLGLGFMHHCIDYNYIICVWLNRWKLRVK